MLLSNLKILQCPTPKMKVKFVGLALQVLRNMSPSYISGHITHCPVNHNSKSSQGAIQTNPLRMDIILLSYLLFSKNNIHVSNNHIILLKACPQQCSESWG